MPTVRVSISLPYLLRLNDGAYPTSANGDAVELCEGPAMRRRRTPFAPRLSYKPTPLARTRSNPLRERFADQLLGRTNRLVRWYRAARKRADLSELTRAQASPFRFEVVAGAAEPAWAAELRYDEVSAIVSPLTVTQLTDAVRGGLLTGGDPPVEDLFLLDAEHALQVGRFREAVLFCWSTIDSVFNRKYESLANVKLAGEWASARKIFHRHRFRHEEQDDRGVVPDRGPFALS